MEKKDTKTGAIIGFIIFSLLAIVGAYGTIRSSIFTYMSYKDGATDGFVVFGFLGLFMLVCFLYFSKELYYLIKQMKDKKERI